MQPAVVIVKTIYTDEEAQRREEEEDLFRQKFEEIEGEVQLELFHFDSPPFFSDSAVVEHLGRA